MTDSLFHVLHNLIADVRPNEPLGSHTTVRVGGPARVMAFPRDEAELATAFRVATRVGGSNLEMLVLGGGANCFADSRGYNGLVLSLTQWYDLMDIGNDGTLVVGGGAPMREVALAAVRAGWGGIDFMAVVPGTVGGAVVINAGTHSEGYIADHLVWVETLNRTGERRRYEAQEMDFGYRTSRLLHTREVVTRAAFRLPSCDSTGQSPHALLERFEKIMEDRRRKFPLDLPNFGSTFRSPGSPHPPAGKLIDELGLKGTRVGDAQISEKHGNFIVNVGQATSDDVIGVMEQMYEAVRKRYGITLKPEVHYLANRDRPRPPFFAPPPPQNEKE